MNDCGLAVTVTQKELEEIATRKREIRRQAQEVRELEKNCMALLASGAEIEEGRFVPELTFRIRHGIRLRIIEHAFPLYRLKKAS